MILEQKPKKAQETRGKSKRQQKDQRDQRTTEMRTSKCKDTAATRMIDGPGQGMESRESREELKTAGGRPTMGDDGEKGTNGE